MIEVNIINEKSIYEDIEYKFPELNISKVVDFNGLASNTDYNIYHSYLSDAPIVYKKRIFLIRSLVKLMCKLNSQREDVYYPYDILDEGIGFVYFNFNSETNIYYNTAYLYYGSRYNPSNSDIDVFSLTGYHMNDASLNLVGAKTLTTLANLNNKISIQIEKIQSEIFNLNCT